METKGNSCLLGSSWARLEKAMRVTHLYVVWENKYVKIIYFLYKYLKHPRLNLIQFPKSQAVFSTFSFHENLLCPLHKPSSQLSNGFLLLAPDSPRWTRVGSIPSRRFFTYLNRWVNISYGIPYMLLSKKEAEDFGQTTKHNWALVSSPIIWD